MKSKRHSPPEISAKLEQAQALAAAGKRQSEIAAPPLAQARSAGHGCLTGGHCEQQRH
jgi:hypothetical protein